MSQIGISAIAASVPQRVLTNFDLEKMVETTDEWIVTRTGIHERHIMNPEESITDFVIDSAKLACQKANLSPEKVELIISSTIAPGRLTPAQAFEVAKGIGANQMFGFDLNTACSGLTYGIAVAESLMQTRNLKYALVTAAEQLSRLIDYTDRTSCVLFGDAAATMVLTSENPEHLIIATELGADPSLANEVHIGGVSTLVNDQRNEYYFRQNGKTVFKFAVNKIKEMYEKVPAKVGLKPEQIKYVIPHQANMRILEAAAKDIQNNGTTFLGNLERYGNTSSASIALVLAEEWQRFEKGDYILLIGFGGGLSWGATLIEW